MSGKYLKIEVEPLELANWTSCKSSKDVLIATGKYEVYQLIECK